ncbi:MAG: peptidase M16, partial [Legionellales bacterium RIFCSPHIGHO2_12_FULL_42_9]
MRYCIIILCVIWNAATLAANDMQRFTLDNGLKIIVKEDHRFPVVVSQIWYNIGSADEPGGLSGISHVLEHMMFKETTKYPVGYFAKTIAALGGQENAMTNYDYTVYFASLASAKLATALELEAIRMQNLVFNAAEFAKEIKVIQEERRLRTDNNPEAITYERYMAEAYLSIPYHHPIIGWMNDLKEMQVADVKAWYANFYAPNNATLVVVGDVKPNQVYQLAKIYFDAIPRHPNYLRKQQVEPPNTGPKFIKIQRPAKMPFLMLGYTVPSIKTSTTDWDIYALELIAGILDAGEGSRLSKNLIQKKFIANNIEVYYNPYTRYQTQFIITAIPAKLRSVDELRRAILSEIQNLQTTLIKSEELARIKTQLIAQKTF